MQGSRKWVKNGGGYPLFEPFLANFEILDQNAVLLWDSFGEQAIEHDWIPPMAGDAKGPLEGVFCLSCASGVQIHLQRSLDVACHRWYPVMFNSLFSKESPKSTVFWSKISKLAKNGSKRGYPPFFTHFREPYAYLGPPRLKMARRMRVHPRMIRKGGPRTSGDLLRGGS